MNIFNLARTQAPQSIRSNSFYVRNLPLSKEVAINLQSFGGDKAPLLRNSIFSASFGAIFDTGAMHIARRTAC